MPRIDAFLKLGLAQGCSDIHLAVGVPPMLRMNGDLMTIKFRQLEDTELESYVMEILTDSQKEIFYAGQDLDFSYVTEESSGRFRVNLFQIIILLFEHLGISLAINESSNMILLPCEVSLFSSSSCLQFLHFLSHYSFRRNFKTTF